MTDPHPASAPARPDMPSSAPIPGPAADIAPDIATTVLVVGGGLAGLTLACALAGAGVDVACIDRDTPDRHLGPDFDGRTTALAYGSRLILEGCGIWRHLAKEAEPILDIRVADSNSPLFLHYDHRDVNLGPLGHIVENAVIRRALFTRAAELPGLRHLTGMAVTAIERSRTGAAATLSDGRRIAARLVVGADGRQSFCRRSAGIGVVSWGYGQTAITCNIAHEKPHHGVAVEHFLPSGPFAVLPMTGNRSSIVWSERTDRVARYVGLDEAAFAREVERRAGPWLGRVRPVTPRSTWPIGVMHAERYADERLALVGEAAHSMHPIAGQGLNMGLRDVAALAEVVVDAHRLGLDPGDPGPLARFQRWRRFDNMSLILVTDVLTRLFSNDIAPLRLARDVGMAAVHRLPPLKRFFMRHAMGVVGELPRLIRGEPL
jgi:2-octaprenyl-6-methoxyphenol hydroxylase